MKGGRDLKPGPGGAGEAGSDGMADRPLVPAYAPCRPGRLQRHLLSGEFDQLRDFPIFESNFVQVWSPGPPPLLCELWPAPMIHRPVEAPEPSHLKSPTLRLVCGFSNLCLHTHMLLSLSFLNTCPTAVFLRGTVDDTQGLAPVRQQLYHLAPFPQPRTRHHSSP
ncbi:Fam71e1 [Phodopus roborovskii]|uniref:Fam71e1 protein n=1 Tax=Phodopus roborovskii TaxID=109678 RepID=A0AAV0ACF1_PHORO|nr:Fam71e1 [Phodopus roborovskii]